MLMILNRKGKEITQNLMYMDTQKYVIVAHFVWFSIYMSESFSVNFFSSLFVRAIQYS